MNSSSTTAALTGFASWLVFALSLSIGGFGLLENLGSTTHLSNWLFFLSVVLAAVASFRLIRTIHSSGALSFDFLGGLAGLVFLGTLAALALMKWLRYV